MVSSDGLHIRWRETAPDRGLLAFALGELEVLHGSWPETVQCNIIIERAPAAPAAVERAQQAEQTRFRAHVEVKLGRRKPSITAKAIGDDTYAALRRAFGDLRHCMPVAAQPQAPAFGDVFAA